MVGEKEGAEEGVVEEEFNQTGYELHNLSKREAHNLTESFTPQAILAPLSAGLCSMRARLALTTWQRSTLFAKRIGSRTCLVHGFRRAGINLGRDGLR